MPRALLQLAAVLAAAALGPVVAWPQTPPAEAIDDAATVRHVLDRLAFGPRPGQVEAVQSQGWREWARSQLDPAGIPNQAVDRAVAERWPSLRMTMGRAFQTYRPAYSSEPPPLDEVARNNRLYRQVRQELVDSVIHRAVHSERQFEEVIVEFWRNHFNVHHDKDDVAFLANHYEEHAIRRHAFGRFEDMLLATARHPAMLIYLDNIVSQRPLTEREEALVARFEGREYLPRSVAARQRQRGLNENYARELMELHTLGVDNGYTQRDVTELARVLTGWTARWDPADEGEYGFWFNAQVHDDGEKRLLGVTLPARGGEEQGVAVIRSLANHPAAAEFISRKLCRYLVNDHPSEALVRRVADVFRDSGGDLPRVYEAIVFSDEFIASDNVGAKFKTPFEFVVSSLRATAAEADSYDAVAESLRRMGQPVYGCEDPTGYDDRAERWLDPGVLVYRWTYAISFTNGGLLGVRVPESFTRPLSLLPAPSRGEAIAARLLPPRIDERQRRTLFDAMAEEGGVEQAVALAIGSPAFQQQ